ncbi:hypothetical protein DACRYDRAFT_24835 [Dacryopinax primogenitus]|uniref:Uncharacterized protein n=1 Tax=Dacryopinax primogenitus (strain DJM 731) TaxID=1858805 RepID=M5FNT5_DACPD|nr:uncharacterized protein DACRYDRAFT_24835 [Dacryopinax primogenitus]EJT97905.1 hypothetical protein DACRYDRAFT_24835 [Dacryopinax primogenitus]
MNWPNGWILTQLSDCKDVEKQIYANSYVRDYAPRSSVSSGNAAVAHSTLLPTCRQGGGRIKDGRNGLIRGWLDVSRKLQSGS